MKYRSSIFTVLRACALLMTITLSACVTPVQHATPSGKVETTINGTSKAAVKNALIDSIVNRGFTVTKSEDTTISFDRPMDNPMAVLLGSNYNSIPNARITFYLIESNKSVRVIADCAIITNPSSGFEERHDANANGETANLQQWLDDIKSKLEKKKH